MCYTENSRKDPTMKLTDQEATIVKLGISMLISLFFFVIFAILFNAELVDGTLLRVVISGVMFVTSFVISLIGAYKFSQELNKRSKAFQTK